MGRIIAPIVHLPNTHNSLRRLQCAADPELLDCRPPVLFGGRVIQRAFKGDRGGADDQRRVDDATVTDDPADIGRGPPHIGWL